MRTLLAGGLILMACGAAATAQQTPATGLKFLDREQYLSIPPAPPPVSGPLPHFRDLSADFPPPGDQGRQQSCVGWAVGYALKSYHENREYRLQGLASDFRFSPSFIYNQIKDGSCSGGSRMIDALNVIESQGIVPVDRFGYRDGDCHTVPTEAQVQSAWEYRIARWMRVNVQSQAEMKAQLARGFPVLVGIAVHEAFARHAGADVYNRQPSAAGRMLGGHAMVVVGYSDQLKAFRVLNSWGTGWGDGGYAWVGYEAFRSFTEEGYVTIDILLDRSLEARGGGAPGPVASSEPRRPTVADRPVPPSASGPRAPSTTPAPSGDVARGQVLAPPRQLTAPILTAAVRSSTEPKVVARTKSYTVHPYSVWLDLPDELGARIERVEYWFNHPTFINPKRSEKGSNIFIAKWSGYGCITDAKVIAFMKDGGKVEAPFDLCAAQQKI